MLLGLNINFIIIGIKYSAPLIFEFLTVFVYYSWIAS